MKCQKCGKEANVYYTETINGRTREIHLCSECANETGFFDKTNSMFKQMEREMIESFALPFGGSIFSRSTAPLIGTFFEPLQHEQIEETKKEPEKPMNKEEALKAKLLDAIADERYEDAAKLRDELKGLRKE